MLKYTVQKLRALIRKSLLIHIQRLPVND